MSVEGLLDVKIINETRFYDFVQKYVLPHLMPLNGHNPHSFVIMDNCAIHHIQEIATMIEDVGSLVHYPYSPDFNPIDSAFLKVEL